MLVQISTKITIIKALLNILPSSAGAGASVGLLVSGIGICFIPPRTRTCLSVVAYARKDKTKWAKYYDAAATVAEWAVDVAYSVDDMAVYKSKVYRCLIAHVSTLALDPEKAKTYWVEVK